MSTTSVNCNRDFRFQTRIEIPGTDGRLRDAQAGEVTNVKLRLSATQPDATDPTKGLAINPAVNNLAAAENSGAPALQYVTVDSSLLVLWVLPLGRGQSFYAIWSRTGDFDDEYVEFLVGDRDNIA